MSDYKSPGLTSGRERKTILIVDDSDFDRSLLVTALARKGGYRTLQAAGADECLGVLSQESVDLVLLDIMMAGSSGLDLLGVIRATRNQFELPVIMVTAKTDSSDIAACLSAGANDYVTKPVNFEVAVCRMATHLRLAELSREISKIDQLAALDALIATYNHEINNPLAIALGNLNEKLLTDEAAVERVRKALWRIADTVRKIREVTERKQLEYQVYPGTAKLLKMK